MVASTVRMKPNQYYFNENTDSFAEFPIFFPTSFVGTNYNGGGLILLTSLGLSSVQGSIDVYQPLGFVKNYIRDDSAETVTGFVYKWTNPEYETAETFENSLNYLVID